MPTYKPFANTRVWDEWDTRNCGSCKEGFDMKRGKFKCDYQHQLTCAHIGDGIIGKRLAKAIGYLDNIGCSIWECPMWGRK